LRRINQSPDKILITNQTTSMKRIFLLAFVTISLFACSSPTRITSSWRDPNVKIADPAVHKIVVAALLYDQGVRRSVEDYMSSLYPGEATQSYLIFGDSLVLDTKGETQRLKDLGFDGIVIMKQVAENTSQHYIPGMMPSYYTTWGGYWGNGWGGPRWGATYYYPGTPGHVQVNRTWTVQVNAYSLITNKLIWSAETRTTNPGGRMPLFEDVCNSVRAEMKKQGFLI
jgi:hypothetical protein